MGEGDFFEVDWGVGVEGEAFSKDHVSFSFGYGELLLECMCGIEVFVFGEEGLVIILYESNEGFFVSGHFKNVLVLSNFGVVEASEETANISG